MMRADPGVDVWRAGLDLGPTAEAELRALLDEEERARAAAFAFERDRRRFTVAHGVLRSMLGACLGVEPGQVELVRDPNGKPQLGGEHRASDVRFNMSHSGAVALYAVVRGRQVGVDVEAIRPNPDLQLMADQFFSAAEAAAIRSASEGRRAAVFTACWVRKEAWLKALGSGLSAPIDRFEVPTGTEPGSSLVCTPAGAGPPCVWSLELLDVGTGYAAAVAVAGEGCVVTLREWPGAGEG